MKDQILFELIWMCLIFVYFLLGCFLFVVANNSLPGCLRLKKKKLRGRGGGGSNRHMKLNHKDFLNIHVCMKNYYHPLGMQNKQSASTVACSTKVQLSSENDQRTLIEMLSCYTNGSLPNHHNSLRLIFVFKHDLSTNTSTRLSLQSLSSVMHSHNHWYTFLSCPFYETTF